MRKHGEKSAELKDGDSSENRHLCSADMKKKGGKKRGNVREVHEKKKSEDA